MIWVHRIGENDQRDFLGDLGKTCRHIRMRPPGRHPLVDEPGILVRERDTVSLTGPLQRIVNHIGIGLPVAEDLVQAVGGKILDELQHLRFIHAVSIEVARGFRHLEVGQCAVAVEGDEFRAEGRHTRRP